MRTSATADFFPSVSLLSCPRALDLQKPEHFEDRMLRPSGIPVFFASDRVRSGEQTNIRITSANKGWRIGGESGSLMERVRKRDIIRCHSGS